MDLFKPRSRDNFPSEPRILIGNLAPGATHCGDRERASVLVGDARLQ